MKHLAQLLLFLVMICPICQKNKEKSRVFYDHSYSELKDCYGFWDEEGVFHQPKCREVSTHWYNCSNTHVFYKTGDDLEEMVKSEEAENKEKKK